MEYVKDKNANTKKEGGIRLTKKIKHGRLTKLGYKVRIKRCSNNSTSNSGNSCRFTYSRIMMRGTTKAAEPMNSKTCSKKLSHSSMVSTSSPHIDV